MFFISLSQLRLRRCETFFYLSIIKYMYTHQKMEPITIVAFLFIAVVIALIIWYNMDKFKDKKEDFFGSSSLADENRKLAAEINAS